MSNAGLAALDARVVNTLLRAGMADAAIYTAPGANSPTSPNCSVMLDRAVQVLGDYGEVIGARDVATFIRSEIANPKIGAALAIGLKKWTLEKKTSEDESISEWVLADWIGDLLMNLVAPIPLVPSEGGTVNATPAADITVFQVNPAASISAASLTADNGATPGQMIVLSFVTMYAAGRHISALTFAGGNFSAPELALAGGPAPGMFYLFQWNGAKWVLLLYT